MSEWHGFPTFEHPDGRRHLRAAADYGGPDDDPTPLLVLMQSTGESQGVDLVELTADELRWLVDVVAPVALKRMGERP